MEKKKTEGGNWSCHLFGCTGLYCTNDEARCSLEGSKERADTKDGKKDGKIKENGKGGNEREREREDS